MEPYTYVQTYKIFFVCLFLFRLEIFSSLWSVLCFLQVWLKDEIEKLSGPKTDLFSQVTKLLFLSSTCTFTHCSYFALFYYLPEKREFLFLKESKKKGLIENTFVEESGVLKTHEVWSGLSWMPFNFGLLRHKRRTAARLQHQQVRNFHKNPVSAQHLKLVCK